MFLPNLVILHVSLSNQNKNVNKLSVNNFGCKSYKSFKTVIFWIYCDFFQKKLTVQTKNMMATFWDFQPCIKSAQNPIWFSKMSLAKVIIKLWTIIVAFRVKKNRIWCFPKVNLWLTKKVRRHLCYDFPWSYIFICENFVKSHEKCTSWTLWTIKFRQIEWITKKS